MKAVFKGAFTGFIKDEAGKQKPSKFIALIQKAITKKEAKVEAENELKVKAEKAAAAARESSFCGRMLG